MAIGVGVATVAAIAALCALAAEAASEVYEDVYRFIAKSKTKSFSETDSKEKETTISSIESTIYIYRHRGTNPGNLVPTKNDVNFNSGLSFSTIYQPNSFKTTIEKINATGVLLAIKDSSTHVSVYPIGGTIADWRNLGTSSIWTQALLKVCNKVKWDGGI